MSNLKVFNISGEQVGSVVISDSIADASHSPQVLRNALVAYRANQRSGNHSTLTKGEVAGSGKKPWRQKGTGRARAGYKQSPLWRGGGVVFGPKPRDYSLVLTQKSNRAALRVAISQRIKDGCLSVIDSIEVKDGKTKELTALLAAMKFERGLIVVEGVNRMLSLSARNLRFVEVVEARNLTSYQLLGKTRVVMTKDAVALINKRMSAASEAV